MMVEKVSVVVPLRDKVRERVHQLANHQLARLFTESCHSAQIIAHQASVSSSGKW